MHFTDKVLKHLLCHGEVGNNTIFHRADGGNIAWRATEHTFGVGANRCHAAHVARLADSDYGRFIENDATTAYINQCVGRTQVDRQIAGKQPPQTFEHGCCYLVQTGNPVRMQTVSPLPLGSKHESCLILPVRANMWYLLRLFSTSATQDEFKMTVCIPLNAEYVPSRLRGKFDHGA